MTTSRNPEMPAPTPDPQVPDQLNQYQLIRPIGRGRTGVVYEAIDHGLRRIVAVKVLVAEPGVTSDSVWPFIAQAATAARIVHNNVAGIYFIGQECGYTFCAREFASGGTLASNREQIRGAGVVVMMEFAAQVLDGLAAAHAIGVVHGNLHSGNVLFDSSRQRVLLSDFQGGLPAGRGEAPDSGSGFVRDLNEVGALLESLIGPQALWAADCREQSDTAGARLLETFSVLVRKLQQRTGPDGFRSAVDAARAIRLLCIQHDIRIEREGLPPLTDRGPEFRPLAAGLDAVLLPESVIAFDRWVRDHPREYGGVTGSKPVAADRREEETLLERAISDVRLRLAWLDQFGSVPGKIDREPAAATDALPEQSIFLPDEDNRSTTTLRTSLDDALRRLIVRQEALGRQLSRNRSGDHWRGLKILLIVASFGWMIWLFAGALNLSPRVAFDAILELLRAPSLFDSNGGGYSPDTRHDLGWVPQQITHPPLLELRLPYSSRVTGLGFCPGRSVVAVGADDGSVHFLLAETGQQVQSLLNVNFQRASPVSAIHFSPDGQRLAMAGSAITRCVQLVDVASGRLTQAMRGNMNRALSAGFSFDGKLVGALIEAGHISSNQKSVVLFDVETAEVVERLPEIDGGLERLVFSPAGPLVALFGGNHPVTIWDYSERRMVRSLPAGAHDVSSLAFSPDGKQLAAGTLSGHLLLWDLGPSNEPRTIRPDQGSSVQHLAYSPDGEHLALIGGGIARIWDCSRESIVRYFVTRNHLASFSSDGRFLATAGGDALPALVWDVSDLRGPTALASAPQGSDEEAAGRHCRHLYSIRHGNSDEFRKSAASAASKYPSVDVQTGNAGPLWQEVTLNTSGVGFDGIRFSAPLSVPADFYWAFNMSASFEDCGIAGADGTALKLRPLQAESNLYVPEIHLLKNNGVYFNELTGGQLKPGKDYVIWFQLNTTAPVTLSVALHARRAGPDSVKQSTSTEIAAAMGWKLPFARTAREYSDTERLEPIVRDLFDFAPQVPFAGNSFPAAPLDDFVTPPDYPLRRKTILRHPQP